MRASVCAVTLCAALVAQSVAGETVPGWVEMDPPAAPGSMAPWLLANGADLFLSWIEVPVAVGGPHRVRFSAHRAAAWSVPVTLTSGTDLFANWADTPGLGTAGNGDLYAHWLRRLAEGKYAYGVEIARSSDRGASWSTLGFVHEDRSPTEHGFASWAAEGDGIRIVWLDGRETAHDGAMSLRSTRLDSKSEGIGPSELVDNRVCDCCATALAATPGGAVAVYRDRTSEEIRDVFASRRGADGWTAAGPVHADGWKIDGCPVNGPQVVSGDGDRLAVAWFTDAPAAAGEERSRVRVAFSADAGGSFGPALSIAGEGAMGRVGLAALPSVEGAFEVVVAWLASTEEGAEIRARRVASDGRIGDAVPLAGTTAARASGFPRLAALAGRMILAWVEPGAGDAPSRLRVASFPAASLPAPREPAGHCG